jgi:hypothetical protein
MSSLSSFFFLHLNMYRFLFDILKQNWEQFEKYLWKHIPFHVAASCKITSLFYWKCVEVYFCYTGLNLLICFISWSNVKHLNRVTMCNKIKSSILKETRISVKTVPSPLCNQLYDINRTSDVITIIPVPLSKYDEKRRIKISGDVKMDQNCTILKNIARF